MLKEAAVAQCDGIVPLSLNPYFNGTCSKRNHLTHSIFIAQVLILILMEHAQREQILEV